MDISQFNKKISKISLFADNLSTDGQFSTLERDLLLSYIRDLYELALDAQNVVNHAAPSAITHSPKETIRPQEVAPEPVKVVSTPPVQIVEQPVVIQPVVPSPPPILEEAKPITPIYAPTPQPVIAQSKPLDNAELAELFADEKVTDLSDKLALAPIKDLTKSMGINERIFTQQELFGNNQAVFNATLEGLNKCQNFDEAKQYLLENVIYTFDWTNENKIKKAGTFIKLIKRKFV